MSQDPILYIGEPLRQSKKPSSSKEVIQSMTEQDYKIIALEATVAQQAKMIEHLRGGLGTEPQLVSYAEDMSTCTLTTGDGTGYFYDRVDPDHPTTGYTAVDMANAARDGFRDGAAKLQEAYRAGWDASGEGWNAEYPCDGHERASWINDRDKAIEAIMSKDG